MIFKSKIAKVIAGTFVTVLLFNNYQITALADEEVAADTENEGQEVTQEIVSDETESNNTNEDSADINTEDIKLESDTTDVTASTIDIDSSSISTELAHAGDEVKVIISTSDKSGINSISLSYMKGDTRNSQIVFLAYNSESGDYEGTIEITDDSESGTWMLYSINIYDNAGNFSGLVYFENPEISKLNFDVEGTNADITPPNVDMDSFTVSKSVVYPNEKEIISVKATDDETGVDSIYITVKSPLGDDREIYKELTYNSETDAYEYIFDVNNYTDPGIWQLRDLTARDVHGNVTSLSGYDNDFSAYTFEVAGTEVDLDSPEIDISKLNMSKNVANIGDEIKYSVAISDAKSGISIAALTLYNMESNEAKSINLNYNQETGLYEGVLKVDEAMTAGQWDLVSIDATDNNHNGERMSGYDYDFSAYALQVTGEEASEDSNEVLSDGNSGQVNNIEDSSADSDESSDGGSTSQTAKTGDRANNKLFYIMILAILSLAGMAIEKNRERKISE